MLVFFLVVFVPLVQATVRWEFGQDSRDLVVIGEKRGKIGLLEHISPLGPKVTKVTFAVPTCMEIKYVLVLVENVLSTPAVTYNRDTSTVYIKYRLLDNHISTYDVMAKGRRSQQCMPNQNHPGGAPYGQPNDRYPYQNPYQDQQWN